MSPLRIVLTSLLGSLTFVACAGGPTTPSDAAVPNDASDVAVAAGGATVNGSLGGRTMSPAYAVALAGFGMPGNTQIIILVGNRPDLCALMQGYVDNPMQRHANFFAIGMTLGDGSPSVVGVGTYTAMAHPNELLAAYESENATCVDSGTTATTGGETVTLTNVGSSYVGTFTVPFTTGTVSGSFDAPLCVLVASDAGPPDIDASMTCVP